MATNNTKQAFWLSVGSLASMGFGIISSMILSRFFDKSDYGTYKQVLYVYNTLLTVFTLGLPRAFSYFLPRVPVDQTKSLIKKITNLFFVLGGIFSLFLFFCSSLIAAILKNPDLTQALRIFAIVPFLMMPTMGLEGILATFKKTKFMAVYTVVTRLIMLLCVALPIMIWHFGYIEAIIGFVIGSFLSFILALFLKYYPVRSYGNELCKISYKEIFQFSLPLLYASIWGIIIKSSDQFFISRYFGNDVFADFSNGSFELPFFGMVVGACAGVLSPVFSRMSYEKVDFKKEVFPIWISVFKKTAMLIYPLVIFCIFFSDEIMVVLYGQQYFTSGYYFRVKSLTYFFSLIVYAPLIINTGNVKFYSRVHMMAALGIVLFEYISIRVFNSPYVVSWVSLCCNLGIVILMLLFVSKLFSVSFYKLFPCRLIFIILLPSAIILYLLHWLFIDYFNFSAINGLICGFIVYCFLYAVYSWVAKLKYIDIIKPLFSNK